MGKKRNKGIEEVAFETTEQPDKPDPNTAGQAGDTQGLSNEAQASSQSVEELVEEGQYFEAALISGVEDALPADVAEVKTRQVPEDDVPVEYLDDQELDIDKAS